jgi:hypothetical protein
VGRVFPTLCKGVTGGRVWSNAPWPALRTRMLRKLTRDHAVNANDVRGLLGAGVSCEQIEDALAVCVTFNTIDRLSRSFGWARVQSGLRSLAVTFPFRPSSYE